MGGTERARAPLAAASFVSRRRFVAALPLATLTVARAGSAQPAQRVYRVGFLAPSVAPGHIDGFTAALRERGWVVGSNVTLDVRVTDGNPARAEALTRELVQQHTDVIVTNVTTTAVAARRATASVPIVMLTSGYPVEAGLANSLGRPGGNVTGMTIYAGGPVVFGKFMELLRELVPSLKELGIFWGYAPPMYTDAQVAPAVDELRRAARVLRLNLHFWQTGTEPDVEAAITAAGMLPLEALFVTSGVIHGTPKIRSRIGGFAITRRLPVLTDFVGPFFPDGAVLSYSVDFKELLARTAYFVDRILRGANPATLPIEQPTKYELVLNLKMAKAMRFTIPPSLLARADRTFE